jgi:hypothetical protein
VSTLVVYLLLVSNGGPPIGAFTDAAACTRSASGLTAEMKAKDPRYSGRTLYVCQPLDLTRYDGEPAPKWKRQ